MLNCDYYLQCKMRDQCVYIKLYKYGDQLYQAFSALKSLFYRQIGFCGYLEDDHFYSQSLTK